MDYSVVCQNFWGFVNQHIFQLIGYRIVTAMIVIIKRIPGYSGSIFGYFPYLGRTTFNDSFNLSLSYNKFYRRG